MILHDTGGVQIVATPERTYTVRAATVKPRTFATLAAAITYAAGIRAATANATPNPNPEEVPGC